MNILCPNKSLFSKIIINKLKNKFKCNFKNLTQMQFDRICHNYEIILMRFTLNLNYKKKSKIKYIVSPTTGLNHIDSKILNNKKIQIFYLNDKKFLRTVNATAEHTVYLMMRLLKKSKYEIKFGFKKNYIKFISEEINGKKVGIIGFGRIGSKVSKICKAFGAQILIYDKFKKYRSNSSLDNLLQKSDIITIHIPLKNNINFLDKHKIDILKKNCILINTSRGEIINQKDLLSAIKKRSLRLGLDVLSNENSLVENTSKKILNLIKNSSDRHIITPHVGGLTKESIELTDNHVIGNFLKFYEKRKIHK